jgi:hypothetical protein
MLCEILSTKFGLTRLSDLLTKARIAAGNDLSCIPPLIESVNKKDNFCLKINGNDFIDLKNKTITDHYRLLDYSKFDKIIFVTRQNFNDAVLSYGYMDRSNPSSWHRPKNSPPAIRDFKLDVNKVFYLARGYIVFGMIKDHIKSVYGKPTIDCDFDDVEDMLKEHFGCIESDFDISTVSNDIDYSSLMTNKELLAEIDSIYSKVKESYSTFWQGA